MPRYDLLVHSFIQRVAQRATGHLDESGEPDGGALQYGEGNWEKGLPTSDVINHLTHHLLQLNDAFRRGLTTLAAVEDQSWEHRMEALRQHMNAVLEEEDHIGAIGWGLMVLSAQLDTVFYHDPAFVEARR